MVTEADGAVAGIVTPRDLLKVYLRRDDDIRTEILAEVIGNPLGCDPDRARVTVADGMVTLGGEVERKAWFSWQNGWRGLLTVWSTS